MENSGQASWGLPIDGVARAKGLMSYVRSLLGVVLGDEPAEVPAVELLGVVRANALPILPIAKNLELFRDPHWRDALSSESQAISTRTATLHSVTSALGTLTP